MRKSWCTLLMGLGVALCLAGCQTFFPKPVYTPPVSPAPEKPPPPQAVRPTLYVAVNRLNLRACPGMDCPKIAVLERNEEVEKVGDAADWSQIRVKRNGTIGWVSSRYLSPTPGAAVGWYSRHPPPPGGGGGGGGPPPPPPGPRGDAAAAAGQAGKTEACRRKTSGSGKTQTGQARRSRDASHQEKARRDPAGQTRQTGGRGGPGAAETPEAGKTGQAREANPGAARRTRSGEAFQYQDYVVVSDQ
jgi:hypothetical protein